MAAANLGIPWTASFNAKGEPASVAQKWQKWLKQFQYFEDASRINNNSSKKALLLHLAGTGTQDIYIQDINSHQCNIRGITRSTKYTLSSYQKHSLWEIQIELS